LPLLVAMPEAACQAGPPLLCSEGEPRARQQARALKLLQGKVRALRSEHDRLLERHSKLASCMAAEAEQLRGMLQARSGPCGKTTELLAAEQMVAAGMVAVVAEAAAAAAGTAGVASTEAAATGAAEAAGEASWVVRPIGRIRSPFVEKNGTPRQGCVVPSARAKLRLCLAAHPPGTLNASHALEGLGAFSHVWLLWLFDRDSRSAAKSKVRPPRLDGAKTGLYSTRTPHRPNRVGLSLVRLLAVEGDTLHLSGVDLCDGTAVVDVKPYVPFADTAEGASVAPWLADTRQQTPDLEVVWSEAAAAELRALLPQLRLLRGEDQARAAVSEVLAADPRSVHWRQTRAALDYGFSIDLLNVVCRFDGGACTVRTVQHLHLCDRSHVAGDAGGGPLADPS